MAFLVLHADRAATVLADDPLIPAQDLPSIANGLSLLAEARSIRERASARADAEAEAARRTGHAEGHAAGQAAAKAEQQQRLFQLSVQAARERRRLRADVAAFSVEIVRRIAGTLGNEAVVAAIADRAAAELLPDTVATLRVHPSAADAVRAHTAHRPGVTVEADERLAPMECLLETALGHVRAGLETQLAAIQEAMTQVATGDESDGC